MELNDLIAELQAIARKHPYRVVVDVQTPHREVAHCWETLEVVDVLEGWTTNALNEHVRVRIRAK